MYYLLNNAFIYLKRNKTNLVDTFLQFEAAQKIYVHKNLFQNSDHGEFAEYLTKINCVTCKQLRSIDFI